jgi:hypothetical protein
MATMVFVEGLWHTGKSFFLNKVKEVATEEDRLVVHDVPRRFLTVRHAMYLYYPLIYRQNQVFDRSPITTKALSDPNLGIYSSDRITPKYWNEFYQEWVAAIKESQHNVIVLYFRPFNSGEVQVFSSIEKYVQRYPKDYLLVDPRACTAKRLTALHETYVKLLLELKRGIRKKFQYYQIEFRDTEDALEALRYEGVLKDKAPLIELPEEDT